ncbi:uncharacterized protein LOC144358034 [Saccoglossus kowalevskii]
MASGIGISYFIWWRLTKPCHSSRNSFLQHDSRIFDVVEAFNVAKLFTRTGSTTHHVIEYLNPMLTGLPSKSSITTESPRHIEYLNLMLVGRCPSQTERNLFNDMIKETKIQNVTEVLAAEKRNHEKEVQDLKKQISSLQNALEEKETEIQIITGELKRVQLKSDGRATVLAAEKSNHEKEVQDLKKQMSILQNALEAKETEIQSITDELKRVQLKSDGRATVLAAEKSNHEKEVQDLKKQMSSRQNTLKEKLKETEIQNITEEKGNEKKNHGKELQDLEIQISFLRNEIRQRDNHIKELKGQIPEEKFPSDNAEVQ